MNRANPMPITRLDWIVITIVALILGGVWIGVTRAPPGQAAPAARSPGPEIGHPAPDFTLTAPDGSQVSLSDFRGQPVVLNFWATWCPPCRTEAPALQSASESLKGEAVILGVSLQESSSTVSAFAEEFGVTYPVVLDQSGQTYLAYRVRNIPTTFFIDERGVVVEVFSDSLNEPLILTRLDQLPVSTSYQDNNMLPVLQIGPLSIRTPGLVLLAGLWIALEVASRVGVRRGIDGNKVYNLGFFALVVGVLGARMGFVLFHPVLYARIAPLTRLVGSVFSPTPGTEVPWVGVLLAVVVVAYLIRRWQLDPLALADSFAPAFAILGIAIGLANLLSGNMYGVETRLPWAINLWGAARHPTQVYLALACAGNLALLLRLRSKEDALPPGMLFQVSLAILSLTVLLVEPLRADSPVLVAGVRTWQVIALGVLAAVLAGFAWRAPAAQPDSP